MEKLYKSMRAIILFLIIMLVIETAFSDKTAQKTAILILMSMLILNSETVATWLESALSVFDIGANNNSQATEPDDRSSKHTADSGQTHGGSGKGF